MTDNTPMPRVLYVNEPQERPDGSLIYEGDASRFHARHKYILAETMPADWHEDSSLATWFPITAEELNRLRAATQPPSTPAALWRQDGSPDPHTGKYDCERAQLLMGEMTDDEIANELFMQLPVGMAGIGQAVKDRIRWLSRKLVETTQPQQATDVNYLIRDLDIIRVILESSKDAVSADFQRIERLQDFIRNAALQSPAVPTEVQKALATYFPFDHLEHEEQQALAALDRIEAVETVTVLGAGELSREIQTWRFDDSSEELFEDYIMRKFPNGLRIVSQNA